MFRLLGILITLLFAMATAIVAWPQFFRLEQTFPVAQIVAVRGAVVVVMLGIAVLALLLLLARPLRGFAASVLIVALLGAAAIGGVGAWRGVAPAALPEKTDGALRVHTAQGLQRGSSAEVSGRPV